MNNTFFVGNLGSDPVVRPSNNGGSPRTTFSVAVSEKNMKTGEEKTHWINVTAFGSLGENIAKSLTKGNRVVVTGRFDSYKKTVTVNGQNGPEVKDLDMLSFVATSVGPDLTWQVAQVAKSNPNGGGQGNGGGYAQPQAQQAPVQQPVQQQAAGQAAGGFGGGFGGDNPF